MSHKLKIITSDQVCLSAVHYIQNHFGPQIQSSTDGNPFVIGIGSGTTVAPFIYFFSSELKISLECKPKIVCIPTSEQARFSILNICKHRPEIFKLGTLDEYGSVDVTVDGADAAYFNEKFLIKGGGAAHCQEKIVCEASKTYIILIADAKKVDKNFETQSIPIEVLPSALNSVKTKISQEFGSKMISLEARQCPNGCGKIGPIVTDNGNLVLDLKLRSDLRANPAEIDARIRKYAGVLETGVFWSLPQKTIIYHPDEEENSTKFEF